MHLINEEIKNNKIRIVGDLHSTESIVSLKEALNFADNENLDLVEMSDKDGISICKIMDYNKFLYEQKKAKKTPKKAVLKDIKFGCNIADHDLQISAKKAQNILNEGNKVRVIVVFKGRQLMFAKDMGPELLDKFMGYFDDSVVITKPAKLEGTMYSMNIEKVNKK